MSVGLDITAYSHLKYIGKCDIHLDEHYDSDHVLAFAYPVFTRSFRGLHGIDEHFAMGRVEFIGGYCYERTSKTKDLAFRAGSYGGYGAYRDQVNGCFLGGKSYGDDWNLADDTPFYELVYFADNEGCIGPIAAEKLFHDHVLGRDRFAKYTRANEHYMYLYDQWTAAFDLARQDGLVEFH